MTTWQRQVDIEHRERRRRLLNVLVVLAIVSILATLAVPAVYSAAVRGKIAVALARCAPMLRDVATYSAKQGRFPVDNGQAGFASPESYRSDPLMGIRVDAVPVPGSVHLQFDIAALADADTLVLTPVLRGSSVTWSCEHSTIPKEFLPPVCGRQGTERQPE